VTNDPERFDIHHPDLCPALRWKGQLVWAERDPSVPETNDGLYWCLHTQTCIGPDSALAEPGSCSSPSRSCHRGLK